MRHFLEGENTDWVLPCTQKMNAETYVAFSISVSVMHYEGKSSMWQSGLLSWRYQIETWQQILGLDGAGYIKLWSNQLWWPKSTTRRWESAENLYETVSSFCVILEFPCMMVCWVSRSTLLTSPDIFLQVKQDLLQLYNKNGVWPGDFTDNTHVFKVSAWDNQIIQQLYNKTQPLQEHFVVELLNDLVCIS